jgi:tetratricopeptide (TPR) repeat protein
MTSHNNCFIRSILFYDDEGYNRSMWSQALSLGLKAQNFDEVPFLVPQLLEPSILFEVSRESGIPVRAVGQMTYDLEGPVTTLMWLYEMRAWATPVQRLNLANCLSASCRYELAQEVLLSVEEDQLYADQHLSYLIAKFAISNRLGGKENYCTDFTRIRDLIEAQTFPESRILDAAAQAIVWQIKTKALTPALLDWFAHRGSAAAEILGTGKTFRDQISLSSFNRAYAMIPAERGDVEATQFYMDRAGEFAEAADPKLPLDEFSRFDARKTVLESSLKEKLYISTDFDAARDVATRLLALDPNWSISYHEAAEIELRAEEFDAALTLFRRALEVGLPRKTYSQYMIGACLGALGRSDEAIDAFHATLALDPTNLSAGIAGRRIAATGSAADLAIFDHHIAGWEQAGIFTDEYRELLK